MRLACPGHIEPAGRGGFRVKGKCGKIRFVPVHAMVPRLIEEYLAVAGIGTLFRPVTNNRTKEFDRLLDSNAIYRNAVQKCSLETGVSGRVNGLCVQLRKPVPKTP